MDKATAALAELKQKYASRPEYVTQVHELGWEFAKKQDYAAARRIFTDMQKQFPNHEQAVLLQRSVIQTYVDQGDAINGDQVRQAVEQMKTNYQSHPDYANQMVITADRLRCTRYSKIAGEIYDGLLKQFPDNELAVLWKQFRQIEKALDSGQTEAAKSGVETLFSTYRNEPEFVKHVQGLGWDFKQKGDYATAVRIYADLQKYFPDHERAVWLQRSIVEAYLDQGDIEKVRQAVEQMKTNFRSHPDYVNQMTTTADRLRGKKQYAISKGIYDSLLEQFPNHPRAMWLFEGRVCSEVGMKRSDLADATVETMRQKYSGQADYPDALRLMAYEYRHVGYYPRAIELYESVLSLNPDPPAKIRCIAGIARGYARLGNDAKVQEKVDDLLSHYQQSQPEDTAVYLFGIGEEYYSMAEDAAIAGGNPNQVKANYQKALALWGRFEKEASNHNSPQYAYYSGITNQHLGRYEEAIVHFQRIISKWPQYDRAWNAQFMIAVCLDNLYKNKQISATEAKPRIVEACRKLEEKYPGSKASAAAQTLLTNYKTL
jgi:tetratricopeptide (TPR) repeat protein